MSVETTTSIRTNFRPAYVAKLVLVRVGALPFFLVAALVVFTLASSQFLTGQNIVNVARQSVYLVLVSLGQMIVKINGKLRYLWRAVDHEGEVLETVVTAKRDKAAALKFLKRIMKKYGQPRSVVTDGLCSYPAAMKEIGNADRHEVGRRLNNRAENSHQPFRRRERAMQLFRSAKTLQKFSAIHAQVYNHSTRSVIS